MGAVVPGSDKPPPDLSALLFEIEDAWRAMEHGRSGMQPLVDPIRESERLAAAWRALDEFARSAFPVEKE
jgi:serine/threonine protein kinase HipA of HipAB toxin-antitoxin module